MNAIACTPGISTVSVERYLPPSGAEWLAEDTDSTRRRKSWNRAIDTLLGFGALPDDWDGLGAAAPRPPLIQSAIKFASHLQDQGVDPPAVVSPGPDGTILFTWQDRDTYVNAEIDHTFRVEWMRISTGETARHWIDQLDPPSRERQVWVPYCPSIQQEEGDRLFQRSLAVSAFL